jgi:hypothetical protein
VREFFIWIIACTIILITCLVCIGKAFAEQTIERSIDNKLILLNLHKCDDGGFKAYRVEANVVQSGCWYNDGKNVNITIDGIVTKYDKRLFELGTHD